MKKPFAENVKGTVIIDRRVYKDILKENIALMNKLGKAIETLRFYAYADIHKYHRDNGEMAQDCLKEIEG